MALLSKRWASWQMAATLELSQTRFVSEATMALEYSGKSCDFVRVAAASAVFFHHLRHISDATLGRSRQQPVSGLAFCWQDNWAGPSQRPFRISTTLWRRHSGKLYNTRVSET